MIDPHVHLRDGVLSEKETIKHGCELASEAGFTAVFDMPNTVPTLTSKENIINRIQYAENVLCKANIKIFYSIYGGLTNDFYQIKEVVEFYNKNFPKIIGLKMFAGHSTGQMGIIEKKEQRSVYAALTKLDYKGVLAIHCEKEDLIDNSIFKLEKPETHSLARPPIAEIESIKDQINLATEEKFKGHIHICHISTSQGIKLVKEAKNAGMSISCGATAHHALLNIETYKKHGLFAKMNPPLRGEDDRKAVFEGLINGNIDWIESDHAPHTVADKQKGASGIPGFAGLLLLVQKLREAGCSEDRLKELCGENVNKIFKLSLNFNIPSEKIIGNSLPLLKKGYPYNIF